MNQALSTAPDTETNTGHTAPLPQTVWGNGDYSHIGSTLQLTGEHLCEAMDLRAGSTVLDVAAGNGNASLAAARRFCRVTCTDFEPSLLDRALERANAERLPITIQHADATALPFADESFDNIVSTFGVMFAPNQTTAASELIRVCKTNGKIGMANWTEDGFAGQLIATIKRYIPQAAETPATTNWGKESFITQNFAQYASHIRTDTRWFTFRYQTPGHWLDVFQNHYGPLAKLFAGLPSRDAQQLERDLLSLVDQFNRADDGTMVVPASYSEIVITK